MTYPRMLYLSNDLTRHRTVHSEEEARLAALDGYHPWEPAPDEATTPGEEAAPVNLRAMSKAELVAFALERGLELAPDAMTKAAMIQAIHDHGE